LDLSVQVTLSAMPVFKQLCCKQSCEGLERHFEGTCHRVESVIIRRAQARQEREEQHAAFLVRQARRDEIADRLVKRHADKTSEVSTNADEVSLVDGNCGEDWTVPVSNVAETVLPEKASQDDNDDWNVPQPPPKLSVAAEKELRRLEKKLRDVAKIEDAMAAGKSVDKLQLQKVATKADLLVRLRKTKAGETVHAGKSEKSVPQKTGANGLRASVGELALPTAGCRVHFSGALMFDQQISGWCSLPYLEDEYSEYVGKGKYASNMRAFPKAIGTSFDSVAVDAGTRVTIYSEPNFKGKVLWDRVGPAIVVNTFYKDIVFHKGRLYSKLLKEEWEGELQVLFPPAVREFSVNNMHTWNSGSLVIQDGQSFPQSLDDITEYHALPNPRY